jgi:hypothetical protein
MAGNKNKKYHLHNQKYCAYFTADNMTSNNTIITTITTTGVKHGGR